MGRNDNVFVQHNLIMSLPHKMGIQIVLALLSVSPSIRPSVRPSRVRVRSVFFKTLMGFTNTSAQMSRMMRPFAVRMFV